MTLGSIKNDISALLRSRGGVRVPDDDILAPLVYSAMLLVCNEAHVLALVTINTNENILRSLGGGYYMRFPKRPTTALDTVEIDESLTFALACEVAASLSRDAVETNYYKREAMRHIAQHNFKIYNTEDVLDA